ncbi:nitrite/sulfite reductase [Clostridium sp. SM-530-WT-3G]|uniref:nitrite/sulfite reductase n=1 Tax=Clostridium sp. SM-530-WT-3G TaxID=2725303 RepID=UPI00145D9CD1|nr:nitrite/sulfite reductase [Clostridium sp. SM-530-WT-3G]NME84341.1 nitrite/sulfite reductase [Clostridium sp. SM-530-WT-3G]
MTQLKDNIINDIEVFRGEGHKFLNNELTVMQFKHLSGGMGAYAEKSKTTFMVRFRTPSGIINLDQMKWFIGKAKENNLSKIHFTTRQAIQFHGLSIDAVCDLMKEALDVGIYTRGAGGDFPRNVAISPLSGVEINEAFDVTPYAIEVNNYFVNRIRDYKLPRKLKVSFSNCDKDEAHCSMVDLGFLAVNNNGQKKFKVYVGGGLGNNPKIGVALDELIDPNEVLYHVEAMTRLFMAEGDYNNRAKARVRYILDRMGEEEFKKCYQKHLAQVKEEEKLDINVNFAEVTKEGIKTDFTHKRLIPQKQDGLYSVYFHPFGGQAELKDLNNIFEFIKYVDDVQLRLSMAEGIFVRNLNGKEAEKLIEITQNCGGETRIEQSVACIGAPTCQIGMGASQTMAQNIIEFFNEKGYSKDVLPSIHISGCGNSCAFHQGSLIGLTGKKKRVDGVMEDAFELHINGTFGEGNVKLAKVFGLILAKDIPQFMYELSLMVEAKNIEFEKYAEKYEEEIAKLVEKFN